MSDQLEFFDHIWRFISEQLREYPDIGVQIKTDFFAGQSIITVLLDYCRYDAVKRNRIQQICYEQFNSNVNKYKCIMITEESVFLTQKVVEVSY